MGSSSFIAGRHDLHGVLQCSFTAIKTPYCWTGLMLFWLSADDYDVLLLVCVCVFMKLLVWCLLCWLRTLLAVVVIFIIVMWLCGWLTVHLYVVVWVLSRITFSIISSRAVGVYIIASVSVCVYVCMCMCKMCVCVCVCGHTFVHYCIIFLVVWFKFIFLTRCRKISFWVCALHEILCAMYMHS